MSILLNVGQLLSKFGYKIVFLRDNMLLISVFYCTKYYVTLDSGNDPEHVGERGGFYAEMDETDLELRQNLLSQFRRWKRRRRKLWKVGKI